MGKRIKAITLVYECGCGIKTKRRHVAGEDGVIGISNVYLYCTCEPGHLLDGVLKEENVEWESEN